MTYFFFFLHDFRVCSCLSILSFHLKIRMFTPYKLKSAVSYSRLVMPDKRFCFEIYRSLGSTVQSNFYEKNYLLWRLRLKYWWSFPFGEFMYYFELRNSLMLLTYAYNLVLKWAEYPSVSELVRAILVSLYLYFHEELTSPERIDSAHIQKVTF